MPITPNEVRRQLTVFAREWKNAKSEQQLAQGFWREFFRCFGLSGPDVAAYEESVKKLTGAKGRIDAFIPGKVMVEHKSYGLDLEAAYQQAMGYYLALKPQERPRYIITSDFARIRITDLASTKGNKTHECKLAELPKRAEWFMFLVESNAREIVEESAIDRAAAYQISCLHEALLKVGFKGRDLEVLLTRLLFCLFADDTGIFHRNHAFRHLIEDTKDDGQDTGSTLAALFDVLNEPEKERQTNLNEVLAAFPYVNGSLFAERTRIPTFDHALRQRLIECAELDWTSISPAIFGAMFQGVLEEHRPDETRQASRRELGAHYTSERNILRVINPLFMDELRAEYAAAKRSKPKLAELYNKLPTLTFFDPACGCGNFLVVAYRELRRLEHHLIADLYGEGARISVALYSRVAVSQFYGIEIEPSAAHIAKVALWITDHQMNTEAGQRFMGDRPSIPLNASPTIVQGNALTVDWASVLPPQACSYLMGNPPFVGAKFMSDEQRSQAQAVFGEHMQGSGLLDFVACWYVKAALYLKAATPQPRHSRESGNPAAKTGRKTQKLDSRLRGNDGGIKAALVATNSICQGEQVGVLWDWMLQQGIKIHFAHRTFRWSNEGKGNAAVHCVIVGFSTVDVVQKIIYDHATSAGEPTAIAVSNINPYLVDAPDVVLIRRDKPLCDVPEIGIGNKPIDDGNYLFTPHEMATFIKAEPKSEPYFRRWLGAEEFINGHERWCLFLRDCPPSEQRAMPTVYARVQAVKAFRLASKSAPTRKLAEMPTRFHVENVPTANYMVIPEVSSERRAYIPIGYLAPEVLTSNLMKIVSNAVPWHLGVLSSSMHMAWVRSVCGRLKSDYRYSKDIVYNNFPWPPPTDKQQAVIAAAANTVLQTRKAHTGETLADLYDPVAMPEDLQKAHSALNKAVDAAYGYKGDKTDAARVAFLFGQYQKLALPAIAAIQPDAPKPKRRTAVKTQP